MLDDDAPQFSKELKNEYAFREEYKPKMEQLAFLQKFWAQVRKTKCDPMELLQSDKVHPMFKEWSKDPLFLPWLLTPPATSNKQKMAALVTLGLEKMQMILGDPDPKSYAASVQAMRLIIEANDLLPKRWVKETVLDHKVSKLNTPEEIRRFIEEKQQKLGIADKIAAAEKASNITLPDDEAMIEEVEE